MHPRCELPRRSWQLEHNQCHSLLPFIRKPLSFLHPSCASRLLIQAFRRASRAHRRQYFQNDFKNLHQRFRFLKHPARRASRPGLPFWSLRDKPLQIVFSAKHLGSRYRSFAAQAGLVFCSGRSATNRCRSSSARQHLCSCYRRFAAQVGLTAHVQS